MINRILEFSLRQRALVLLGAVFLFGAGLWSAVHLPIDAVPDITGVQVQINTEVPALAGEESEKLVTQPIEREMAGLPGMEEMFYYSVSYGSDATNKPATELEQLLELSEIQEYTIKPLLRTVKGIAEINGSGGYEKQYVIQPNPEAWEIV